MQQLLRGVSLPVLALLIASCDLHRFEKSDGGTGVAAERAAAPVIQPTANRSPANPRKARQAKTKIVRQGAAATTGHRSSSGGSTIDLEARRQARIDYTREFQRGADQRRDEVQRQERQRQMQQDEQRRDMQRQEQRRQQMRDDQRRQEMRRNW